MPVGWHLTDTRCAIGEDVSVRQRALGRTDNRFAEFEVLRNRSIGEPRLFDCREEWYTPRVSTDRRVAR